MRALLIARDSIDGQFGWPNPSTDLGQALTEPLRDEPWALEVPVLLPAGRIATDTKGQGWWRAKEGDLALPLAEDAAGLIRGTELSCAAALWSGNRLAILAAETPWGRIGGHD